MLLTTKLTERATEEFKNEIRFMRSLRSKYDSLFLIHYFLQIPSFKFDFMQVCSYILRSMQPVAQFSNSYGEDGRQSL